MPPLVPVSRVKIEGCDRISIDKVQKYIEEKLVIGMVPTANSQFVDATKVLGPLVEKIQIRKGFFFQATLEVVEKKDFYVIRYGSEKIKVDILGNLIEGAPPENAHTALAIKYIQPDGNEDILPKSEYIQHVQGLVSQALKTRKGFPVAITEIIYNKRDFIINSGGRTFCLVAPRGFSPAASGVELPQQYRRIYMENVNGLYAKTSQGVLVVFGDESNIDIKMASTALLLESLKLDRKPFPLVVKADIPFQVTSVP